MDVETRQALFRKYLRGAETDDDIAALQEWHDDQLHQQMHPMNGSCFCCCWECDPDD